MEQQPQALDRIGDQPPPAWFTVLGIASGAVLVGGTAWLAFAYASQFGSTGLSRAVTEARAPALPTPPSPAPSDVNVPSACSDCGYPGTACENGQCRLAPSVPWRLAPMALVQRSLTAPPARSFSLCARLSGTVEWTCSRRSSQVVPSPGGRWVTNFAAMGPALLATREDLETRGLDVEVRETDQPVAAAQAQVWPTIVAGNLLFKGGLSYPTSIGNAVFSIRLAGQ